MRLSGPLSKRFWVSHTRKQPQEGSCYVRSRAGRVSVPRQRASASRSRRANLLPRGARLKRERGSLLPVARCNPGTTPNTGDRALRSFVPSERCPSLLGIQGQLASFFYRRKIRERLSCFAIVSPSIRSDLSTDEDALRLFALALLRWECLPHRRTVSAGAVSLGRADLPVLPALGLSWTPSTRSRLDLQFPRSRWLCRLAKNGGDSEIWSYLSAGLGGNTWAVTRIDLPDGFLLQGGWSH